MITLENLKGKNCIIYTRVSSQKQLKDFNGLENQKASCEKYVKNNDMNVVKYFSDGGISGKILDRAGLNTMLSFIAEKNQNNVHIHYILVDDIDRIMRDVQGWRTIVAKLNASGVSIKSLKQDITDGPEGILSQNMTMAFKQYERENNQRRTISRQEGRMLNGYRTFTAPVGYCFDFANVSTKNGGRVLIKDETIVDRGNGKKLYEVVRDGLIKYAKGEFLNKTELANYYYDYSLRNYISRSNGVSLKDDRAESQIRKAYLNFIGNILSIQNIYLCGGYIYHKKWNVGPLKANHSPIITEKVMNILLEKEKEKAKFYKEVTKKEIKEEVLLRQIIKCKSCSQPMTGSPSKGKMGKIYFYYTCRTKGCDLKNKSYNTRNVHDSTYKRLEELSLNIDFLKLLKGVFTYEWKEKSNSIASFVLIKEKEMGKLSNNIQKCTNQLLETENDILLSVYEKKIIHLNNKKTELEQSIKGLNSVNPDMFDNLFSKADKILKHPNRIWNIGTSEIKQKLVRVCFCDQIFYSKESGLQTPQIPVVYRLKDLCCTSKDVTSGSEGIEPPVTVPKTVVLPLHQPPIKFDKSRFVYPFFYIFTFFYSSF